MENKFIIVPYDLYNNLLKQDSGELNVDNAKKTLEKISNKRKANKSFQNIMYNQELQRYLKLKKEIENKPVKVELSNGAKLLVAPQHENIKRKKKHKNEKFEATAVYPETLEETGEFIWDDSVMKDTPENYDTAAEESLGIATTSTPKNLNADEKYKAIINLIAANPKKYGVTERGQIIGNMGMPVANSNVNDSLTRILNRNAENAPSPPGTMYLEEKLRKDPLLKQYFKKSYSPQTPKVRITLTSKKLRKQEGTGVLKATKKNLKFRPKTWKRCKN